MSLLHDLHMYTSLNRYISTSKNCKSNCKHGTRQVTLPVAIEMHIYIQ